MYNLKFFLKMCYEIFDQLVSFTIEKLLYFCYYLTTMEKNIRFRRIVFFKNYFQDFFDREQLVVIINGFQKKTQKTAQKDLELSNKRLRELIQGRIL